MDAHGFHALKNRQPTVIGALLFIRPDSMTHQRIFPALKTTLHRALRDPEHWQKWRT